MESTPKKSRNESGSYGYGAGGYGERIVTGLALNDNMMLLAGAVPAAALALIVQVAFELADRWLVPAGLRTS